jgi:hypothetical protein
VLEPSIIFSGKHSYPGIYRMTHISDTCSSKPGLLVQNIDLFHCQMQDIADGTPDDIEAPAPKKRA